MTSLKPLFSVIIATFMLISQAEESGMNEADLFSDTATVTQTPLKSDTNGSAMVQEKKSSGFSGEINAAGIIGFPRHNLNSPLLTSYIVGNMFADARLLNGIKGFVNGEARYTSQTDSSDFHLREIFMDVNIRNKAYFRAGKQILQWGRCYFWNPTDLISIDSKSRYFVQKIGYRDGAFGLKTHIPFGTTANLYAFIDTRTADTLSKTAASIKAEFLAGRTEFAVETWLKKGKPPVVGGDFSSRLLGLDLNGEIAFFREDIENRMAVYNKTLFLVKGDEKWASRAAMGLSKSFTVSGIPNRLMCTLEAYYNGAGYDSRIFEDTTLYIAGNSSKTFMGFSLPDTLTKLDFFIRNGLYRPNEHAQYYAAFFTSLSRFITSDITLSLNAIANIPEECAVLVGGLSYRDLRDLSLGLNVIMNLGKNKREYTYTGNELTIQLTSGISF